MTTTPATERHAARRPPGAVTAALPDTPAPDGAALVTTSAPRSRAGPAGRAGYAPRAARS
ncbi:hypothetical protein [Streptomyces sp. NBC_00094]|uniref:hypothetical protein n=1 Tax=Streptomyces sp. NBC_00094 TaxID=2903620 RepID=UPI00225507B4|nr:hypothetical protein [Streptomyces sp. NBC_00094]MCX5388896.1 hypothetical protein [Streptomyces sp. NBC_00094]